MGTDPLARENNAVALMVALDEAANDIMNLPWARTGVTGHVNFSKSADSFRRVVSEVERK